LFFAVYELALSIAGADRILERAFNRASWMSELYPEHIAKISDEVSSSQEVLTAKTTKLIG
jgi:hypothetical protein